MPWSSEKLSRRQKGAPGREGVDLSGNEPVAEGASGKSRGLETTEKNRANQGWTDGLREHKVRLGRGNSLGVRGKIVHCIQVLPLEPGDRSLGQSVGQIEAGGR